MLPRRLTPRQEWGIAAGGILTALNDEPFDRLRFLRGGEKCRASLAEWWGIRNEMDAKRILGWLLDEGHSVPCLTICEEIDEDGQSRERSSQHNFVADHLDELSDVGVAAFDLCRLVNVARWSVTAGYLAEPEAWDWILRASRSLQDCFASWEEVGRNFILGFEFWMLGQPDPEIADLTPQLDWLLREGPWGQVAWDLDLSSPDPRPDPNKCAACGTGRVSSGLKLSDGRYCVWCLISFLDEPHDSPEPGRCQFCIRQPRQATEHIGIIGACASCAWEGRRFPLAHLGVVVLLVAAAFVSLILAMPFLQADVRMKRARVLQADGRWKDAAAELRAIHAGAPEHEDATVWLIEADLNSGNIAEAGRLLKDRRISDVWRIGDRARTVLPLWERARKEVADEKWAAAFQSYVEASRAWPDSPALWGERLDAQERATKTDVEIQAYLRDVDTSAAMFPRDARILAHGAIAARIRGTADAESWLARAREMCRDAEDRESVSRVEERYRARGKP